MHETMTGSFDHYYTDDDLATIKNHVRDLLIQAQPGPPSVTAIDVTQRLAERLYVACQSDNQRPSSIAAVSVLVASVLTDVPRTVHSVSAMFDVAAAEILGLLPVTGSCCA